MPTSRTVVFPITIALLLLTAYPVHAWASERPLRRAESENRAYQLRIDRGRPDTRRAMPAVGTLIHRPSDGNSRLVWRTDLVNDVAPLVAFIRDDGEFLVTLDEFRQGGAKHALVVYGADGALRRIFTLKQLLVPSDWRFVEATDRFVAWREGADGFFYENEFVLALNHGRLIRIDLEQLNLIADGDEAPGAPGGVLSDELAALLGADEMSDVSLADTAALEGPLAELMAFFPLAVLGPDGREMLIESLDDFLLLKEDLQELALLQDPELMAAIDATDPTALDEQIATADASTDLRPQIDVPAPNPDEFTDYVAWLNDVARRPGASDAMALYSDAAALWTEPEDIDVELWRRAQDDGDPDAVLDPAIQGWLASNAEAIKQFRAAAREPYLNEGYDLSEPDGMMVHIQVPNLSIRRQLARATILQARTWALDGNTDEATAAVLDVARAGRQHRDRETLIESLVGVAFDSIARQELASIIAGDPESIDYVQLRDDIDAIGQPMRTIGQVMRLEEAMALDVAQRSYVWSEESDRYVGRADVLRSIMPDQDALGPLIDLRLGMSSFDGTVKSLRESYGQMAAAAEKPWLDARSDFQQLGESLRNPFANPIAQVLVPSIERVVELDQSSRTRQRLSNAMVAVRAHQQEFGSLPETLDGLVSADAGLNALTGAPLIYERTPTGFTLRAFDSDVAEAIVSEDGALTFIDGDLYAEPNEAPE